jgi:asparagine synthase (glutamine-hydrolysing)
MSFAGLWLQGSAAAAPQLEPALARLASAGVSTASHRSVSRRGHVAFGYSSSVPEARFHSPPEHNADADSELMIAGDVRLDNRRELAAALGLPAEHSDLRLILCAYQRWAEGCAARLLGDFAFAIWDGAQSSLFLVRDACGVRPLFYVANAQIVAFASRADVLLAIPGVPCELDERAVVDYLAELPEDEARTVFAAVRRLPPACSLRVTPGSQRLDEYFDVAAVPPLRLRNDAEYAEALTAVLSQSVARRTVEDRSYGVLMSGGLDSTTVACLASDRLRAAGRSAVHTFSAVFPDISACDERPYQAAVVARCGSEHFEVTPRSDENGGDFAALVRAFGDPAPIGLHWLTWPIAQAARARGISVLLTGIDGDRVVSHGGALFTELARAKQWRRLTRECLTASDFSVGRKLRVLSSQVAQSFIPPSVLAGWDRVDPRRRYDASDSLRFIRPARLAASGAAQRLREPPTRTFHTREAHVQSLKASDRNWDVELLDRLGAATGIEFRHPFFDRDVVSLCVSLPGEQKRRGGYSRYVLRQAMSAFAPERVRARKNHTSLDDAFWVWTRGWMAAGGAGKAPRGSRTEADTLSNLSSWIDVDGVARALKVTKNAVETPASGRGPADFLRRCVVFSRWLEYVSNTGTLNAAGPGD